MWGEKKTSTLRDFKVLATGMLLANNSAFSVSVHWRQRSLPESKEHGLWRHTVLSVFKYWLFHSLSWKLTFNESLLWAKHSSKFFTHRY